MQNLEEWLTVVKGHKQILKPVVCTHVMMYVQS